jgi:hypothetical protein
MAPQLDHGAFSRSQVKTAKQSVDIASLMDRDSMIRSLRLSTEGGSFEAHGYLAVNKS